MLAMLFVIYGLVYMLRFSAKEAKKRRSEGV